MRLFFAILFLFLYSGHSYSGTFRYQITEDTTHTHSTHADTRGTTFTQWIRQPTHGTVQVSNNSVLKYTPKANYCGNDTYSYTSKYGSSGGPVNPFRSELPQKIQVQKSELTQKTQAKPSISSGSNILRVHYETEIVNISIACVNDLPSITIIGTQWTDEDISKAVSFNISDIETAASSLSLRMVSSSNTGLLPLNRISFSGSGSSRKAIFKPVQNKFGYSNVRMRVTDGHSGYKDTTFRVYVNSINDLPTITNIANQSTNEDVIKTVGFNVGDIETPPSYLKIKVLSSSNTGLLPINRISLAGSGSSRSITLNPVANKYGYSDVKVRVTDGANTYREDTFRLSVNSVNDLPSISNIANQSTNEDVNKTVGFTVGDIETTANSLIVQVLSSSNTGLLPLNRISISGSGSSRNVTLNPAANKYGYSDVRMRVTDGHSGYREDTFRLSVNSVNDLPSISNIANQSTNEDISKTIGFNVNDLETTANSLIVQVLSSSNTGLLPINRISLTGSGSSRNITLNPVGNKYGYSDVRMRVTDGHGAYREDTFRLSVNSVNDAPTINGLQEYVIAANSTRDIFLKASDVDSPLSTITVTAASDQSTKINVVSVSNNEGDIQIKLRSSRSEGEAIVTVTVQDAENIKVAKQLHVTIKKGSELAAEIYSGSLPDATISNSDAPSVQSVGFIQGKAGVSGGAATYNIPIDIPPGRGGVQPNISLNYSSRGGSGIAGMGWSINATQAITRCSATFAQDGFTHNPNYDVSKDKLCLNGQRLMLSEGSYGTNGTEYKLEIDNSLRVTQIGELNNANSKFKVEYKNGQIAYFGETDGARVVHEGRNETYSWLLSYQHDSTNKNFINYTYEEYGVAELLLKRIDYTENNEFSTSSDRSVHFVYTENSKNTDGYIAGGYYEKTRKLSNIYSKYMQRAINVYALNYTQSQATGRDLLNDVTLCRDALDSNSCIPSTIFDWKNKANTFELEQVGYEDNSGFIPIHELSGLRDADLFEELIPYGDRDGDGAKDWQGYSISPEKKLTQTLPLEDNRRCFFDSASNSYHCLNADLDLDGLSEYFSMSNDGSGIQMDAKLTSTDRWVYDILPDRIGNRTYEAILNFTDFNGDGYPDVLYRYFEGSTLIHKIALHSGSRFSPAFNETIVIERQAISAGDSPILYSSIGDIDGNGLPDIVRSSYKLHQYFNNQVLLIYFDPISGLAISKDNGFVFPTLSTYSTSGDIKYFQTLTDINGDGLLDLISWNTSTGTGTSETLNYQLNTGTKFLTEKVWLGNDSRLNTKSYVTEIKLNAEENMVAFQNKYPVTFMDIDSDGVLELLVPAQRLVTGCTYVGVVNNTTASNEKRCGEGIYNDFDPNGHSSHASSLLDARKYDDSVYRFDAIKWEKNNNGDYSARRITTDIISTVGDAANLDATGNGLTDVVFSFGPRDVSAGGLQGYKNSVTTNHPILGDKFGLWITRNKGTAGSGEDYAPIDVIKGVTNGIQKHSTWSLLPLSSSAVNNFYSTTRSTNVGYFNFSSSMYVVSSFQQDNGIGGKRITNYKYRDAMFNAQGRGFMGFKSMIEEDIERGLVTQTDFNQIFPRQGKPISKATFTIEDYQFSVLGDEHQEWNALKFSQFTWADVPNTLSHTYLKKKVTITRDLTSKNELSRVTNTVTEIDAYANIINQSQISTDKTGEITTTQTATYTTNTNIWWLDRLDQNTVTISNITARESNDPYLTEVQEELDAQTTLTNIYSSYHNNRKPGSVTTSGSSGLGSTTVLNFNDFGLLESKIKQAKVLNIDGGWINSSRTTESYKYSKNGTSLAVDGYFTYEVKNAKGHLTFLETDPKTGVVTKTRAQLSNNNYLTTTKTLDRYHRAYSVKTDGQPIQYSAVQTPDNHAPNHAVIQLLQVASGQPMKKVYQDNLGRTLRIAVESFDGRWLFTDSHYDSLGRKVFESMPFYLGETPYGITYSAFDDFDRPAQKLTRGNCGDMTTSYTYADFTTNISVSDGCYYKTINMSKTYNSRNQLVATVDALNGITRYAYNGQGQPIVIADAKNNVIKARFDAFGRKVNVNDPNQGVTQFHYNGFNELQQEVRSNGVTLRYITDTLGRMIRRTATGESTSNYVYDTAPYGVGQPHSQSSNGVTQTYGYDNRGRLVTTRIQGEGKDYTNTTLYDGFYGRVKGIRYPNALTVAYQYNHQGYLTTSTNAANGYTYQSISEYDRFANIQASMLGNGLSERSFYDRQRGQMSSKQVLDGSTNLLLLSYNNYDGFGNLKEMTVERGAFGSSHSFSETYNYDDLHRLTNNSVDGIVLTSYDYDATGNLLLKSDYASQYDYDTGTTGGPNAVKRVLKGNSWLSFDYDLRGNMLRGDELTSASYNAMDKPTRIEKSGVTSTFVYGPNHLRFKQAVGSRNTYYANKMYEEEINSGEVTWRAYIGNVAIVSKTTNKNATIRYSHKDRLGSGRLLTDGNGYAVTERNFDPFGKPRLASGKLKESQAQAPRLNDITIAKTNRGFTDHEHLDEQELIHMNGRVYDYNLGRFLSVDPFIQDPGNSQSINPYSYIMNNPLAGTDPTGYMGERLSNLREKLSNSSSIENIKIEDVKKITVTKQSNGSTRVNVEKTNGKSVGQSFEAADIGGLSDRTNQNQTDQLNFSGGQLKGELKNESQLGVAPVDAEDAFNKGLAASESIPTIRKGVGKPKFKNEFAIGYQDKDGNNQVKSFSKFDDANEFAKQSKGGWLDATEQGGYITLYRTATYAKTVINPTFRYQKMRVNHIEGVIMNLAHEGYHAKKGPAESPQLFMSSFGAVKRYRELGN